MFHRKIKLSKEANGIIDVLAQEAGLSISDYVSNLIVQSAKPDGNLDVLSKELKGLNKQIEAGNETLDLLFKQMILFLNQRFMKEDN